MKKIWLMLLLVALGWNAEGATLSEKLETLMTAMKTSIKGKTADEALSMQGYLAALATDPKGESSEMDSVLRAVITTNMDPTVQAAAKAVLEQVQAEKDARLAALKAQLADITARAQKAVQEAKETKDLDGLMAELQKLSPNRQNLRDQETQIAVADIDRVYRDLVNWQDYLAYFNSGQLEQARQSLERLSDRDRTAEPSLLPRSEILLRLAKVTPPERSRQRPSSETEKAAPPDLTPIFEAVKTLDDLAAAAQKARDLKNVDTYDLRRLSLLASRYSDAKNGLPVSIELERDYGTNRWTPGLERLRGMVLMYLLPRYLGDGAGQPKPEETVDNYLKRIFADAESRSDLAMLQRVIQAQLTVRTDLSKPRSAMRVLSGLNQEIAGQQGMAVISYQYALKEPFDIIPATLIGVRLAAIKKANPTEYEAAMKQYFSLVAEKTGN